MVTWVEELAQDLEDLEYGVIAQTLRRGDVTEAYSLLWKARGDSGTWPARERIAAYLGIDETRAMPAPLGS